MIDERACTQVDHDVPGRWQGRSIAAGIFGSVVASLCCLPTAVAIALGLGLSAIPVLGQLLVYQRLFQIAGLAFDGLAIWWMLRRGRTTCGLAERERRRQRVPLYVLGPFAAGFVVLNLVVIPLLEQLRELISGL